MTVPILVRVPVKPELHAALRQRLGDRLSTSTAVCDQHGKDESYHQPHSPDAVAFAQSTEEVAEIVGIPEATVKTRMFYARKKLSELLKAAGLDRGWP